MISIVTVNLNNRNGLKETLCSVQSQDSECFEHILVDGGSTDGSLSLIEENRLQINQLLVEKDSGVYNAMNKGIKLAKGDYILFLNSGDRLVGKDVIEKMEHFISSKSDIKYDIIYCDLIVKTVSGNSIPVKYPKQITLDFLFAGSLPHPATFISRDLFSKIGLYREDFTIVSDWIFFFQAFMHPETKFYHLDMIVSVFEEGGLSSSLSNYNTLQHERKLGLKHIMPAHLLDLVEAYRILQHKHEKLRIEKIYTFLVSLRKKIKGIINPFGRAKDWFVARLNTIISIFTYGFYRSNLLRKAKEVPVIINNRNRLTSLKRLINSLESRGVKHIYIIDNASTYQPLLEFYKTTHYTVFRLEKNAGFCALWDTPIFNEFTDQEYIYTDSDVVLDEKCDQDVIARMLFLLKRHHSIERVGLGLKIDDLPDTYQFKTRVVDWEKAILKEAKEIEKNIFIAPVDTTFALYRKNKKGPAGFLKSVRVQTNNMIRHLPWYVDMDNLDEEEKFYLKNANTKNYTHWTAEAKERLSSSN